MLVLAMPGGGIEPPTRGFSGLAQNLQEYRFYKAFRILDSESFLF